MNNSNTPLKGLRVLDFSRVLSGPYAAMVLADLGAEVIKVEPLETGDDTRSFPPFVGPLSHYFIALNRNKQSISLDLKSPEGREIALKLVDQADIVLENFRPGVMERLELGADSLIARNPRLIYCSISGFGLDGPLRDRPAFDIVVQALSGVMSVNGQIGQEPARLGLPIGDMAGSIFAVFGILAAVHQRHSTGRGTIVEIAMLDSLIAMLGYMSQIFFVTGQSPQPVGSRHPNLAPYGAFSTSDGYVIIACLTERFWHNFAKALDQPELINDPRFCDYQMRLQHRAELDQLVTARMATKSTDAWLAILEAADVPHAPINSIERALEQAHCQARNLIRTVHHPVAGEMRLVSSPMRFDGKGAPQETPPPLLGEHSQQILQSLGYSGAEIAELMRRGRVHMPPSDLAAE